MSEPGGQTVTARWVIAMLVFAATLIAITTYYVDANLKLARLSAYAQTHLLGMPQGAGTAKDAPPALAGLAASPLNQQAVSGTVAARARAGGNKAQALTEAAILRRLGWRSTSALQNLLWRAGTVNDRVLMMDTLDALLRREKLLGQIHPILNLMTQDPEFSTLLVRRLAARPPWRRYYLMGVDQLDGASQVQGRFRVMRAVQQGGDPLLRNEIAPVLPKLIGTGHADQAFALWQTHNGDRISTPLADTGFAVAARPLPGDALPIPFEWQLGSGSGYFADAGQDNRGSFASIDWNGRGTPVFLSQTTSARPGRYRLRVATDTKPADLIRRIGFRMTCPDGRTTAFAPVVTGRGGLQLASEGAVPCDHAVLDVAGLVRPGTDSASVVLRSIGLERIGG